MSNEQPWYAVVRQTENGNLIIGVTDNYDEAEKLRAAATATVKLLQMREYHRDEQMDDMGYADYNEDILQADISPFDPDLMLQHLYESPTYRIEAVKSVSSLLIQAGVRQEEPENGPHGVEPKSNGKGTVRKV
jgi:hypothetical protein